MSDFQKAYEEHARPVYRFLLSLTGNENLAEELLQETFYQAFLHIDRFEGRCNLYTWLCQIGKNAWLKECRRNKHYAETSWDDLPMAAPNPSPEVLVIQKEQWRCVRNAMERLAEPYRSVFILHTLGSVKLKEIAVIYQKSETADHAGGIKMKISCGIAEDLLPLYLDGVCSEQSKNAVTEHLHQCPKCQRLAGVEVAVPEVKPDVPKTDRAVKKGLKKIRTRWWASILTLVALIPVLFLGWNEYSAQGVAYSNMDELRISDQFMQCLLDGDYAKAYSYLDVESKKQTWLENWFDEEKLSNMETDGLKKFCELGEKIEQQLGGFESYEYVGTSKSYKLVRSGDEERFVEDHDGSGQHDVTYRIRIGGEEQIFLIKMDNKKIQSFSGGGSFWTDPLAQFCIWGEYLWQDYEGCYYDTELRTYVYLDGTTANND